MEQDPNPLTKKETWGLPQFGFLGGSRFPDFSGNRNESIPSQLQSQCLSWTSWGCSPVPLGQVAVSACSAREAPQLRSQRTWVTSFTWASSFYPCKLRLIIASCSLDFKVNGENGGASHSWTLNSRSVLLRVWLPGQHISISRSSLAIQIRKSPRPICESEILGMGPWNLFWQVLQVTVLQATGWEPLLCRIDVNPRCPSELPTAFTHLNPCWWASESVMLGWGRESRSSSPGVRHC